MPDTDVVQSVTLDDLELPESCPSCSGPLSVRVTDDIGWAVCKPCLVFTRFEVEDEDRSLALTPLLDAEA